MRVFLHYNYIYFIIILSFIRLDKFHEKGYHKRKLGNELDVVCFLLAVEVERLYEENLNW